MAQATSTSTSRRTRGRGHHRRSSAAAATSSASSASALDQRRYFDFRAGCSPAELAARENVTLATIDKSILRMRMFAARNSQESVELATREVYLSRLPEASLAFEGALTATRTEVHVEMRRVTNPQTGEDEMLEHEVRVAVPDHDTRLKATTALKNLLAGVQPKTPMVAVDARSQTNINNGMLPQSSAVGALSFESITRQIRLEQGKLTAGDIVREMRSEALPDIDIELADDLAEAPEEDDDLLAVADADEDSPEELAPED